MASKKHVFTQLEKNVYTDILKKFKGIIENKDTDGSSLRAKTEAWESITRMYNASPHATIQVTSKQLRRLWMNMKQRQREALTKERQHRVATGGGPSTSDAVIDPNIAEIAPALIVGIEEAIDSDTFTISTQESEIILDPQFFSTPELDPIPSTSFETDPQPSTSQDRDPQPASQPSTSRARDPQPSTSQAIPPRDRSIPSPPPPSQPIQPPPSQPMQPSHPRQTPPPPSATASFQRYKNAILDKEYQDRKIRADQINELEIDLLKEKIREAKARAREAEAKADLAELILRQRSAGILDETHRIDEEN